MASKLQQLTPTNHQPHGGKMKKSKRSNSRNKSSTCIQIQMNSMVIPTTPHGKITPTSDEETLTTKTNNHGRGTQTKTTQETTKTTTSSRLTKTHTENPKITTLISTSTNPTSIPPTKMVTTHHPHLTTHHKHHLNLKDSPT